MERTNKHNDKVREILTNEQFIEWRLTRSETLDEYWDDFVRKNPEYKEILPLAIQQFEEAVLINKHQLPAEEREKLRKRIMATSGQDKRSRRRRLLYAASAVAAAILALVLIDTFMNKPVAEDNLLTQEIMQELNTGNIILVSEDDIIELDQEEASVRMNSDGLLSLIDSSQQVQKSVKKTLSKVIVPAGRRFFLTLADGSKIWLNSCTTLEFPTQLNANEREITVRGEVFAEIAHDAERPFIVHTSDFDVLVHGTSFNVSAYDSDRERSVVLVNGSVSMKNKAGETIRLQPNQMASLHNNVFEKREVDVIEYTGWKDGVFVFNSTPFPRMLTKLERYYNVRFDLDSSTGLKNKSFSGKLYLTEHVDSLMLSVGAITSTAFERIDDTIYIKRLPMGIVK